MAVLLVMAAGIFSNGARTGEFNVKEILNKESSDSGELIISGAREVIELYRAMESWESRGVRWESNIFYPLIREIPELVRREVDEGKGEGETELTLEGIFIGEIANSALINGTMVMEGDTLSGMAVKEITLDRVVLESSDRRRELSFESD
ncbi:MAG: hypothetical protein GF417_07230 [Candidatus Latescibacteria bacterium]|nr:hypothetical protein [bacterium]MBD3424211.1 hypothetical protein [Candidatus Latescibacterota bacterium]